MGATWQSLAWKEWHEHKWKLAAITAVLLGATSLSMLVVESDRLGLAFGMMLMCVIPLAVFVGLSIAANERTRNTLAFLQAQPVPLWHVGLIKLVSGLATLVIPIIVTTILLYVWRFVFDWTGVEYLERVERGTGPIDTGSYFVDIVLYCAPLAMSLMVWSAATGVNRNDEISAGAVALAVMIGWSGVVFFFMWCISNRQAGFPDWINVLALAVIPGGIAAILTPQFGHPELLLGVGAAAIVHLLLAAFYVRQFGQTMERAIVSPKVVTRDTRRLDWLDSPRRSPLAAVVWKQFRESVPIAVVGLTAIIGTATVIYTTERSSYSTPTTHFAETYFAVSISLGFCVALVVGIGVALQDMGPQLNTFWRSRPINGSLWFWTKFVTGLLVVVVAIYGPQMFFSASVDFERRDYVGVVSMVATLHIATYAAAVAMTCLIRHAVYAAILSMGAVTASIAAAWVVWMLPSWLGSMTASEENNFFYGESIEFPVMMTGLIACLVASTVIGWLSMRNDWGWKSRY